MTALGRRFCFAALVVFLFRSQIASATIYKYGTFPDGQAAVSRNSWSYAFLGMDWTTPLESNSTPWLCTTGQEQSPVDIRIPNKKDIRTLEERLRLTSNFGTLTSNGSNVEVLNTGHTLQLEWQDSTYVSDVSVVVPNLVDDTPFAAAVLNIAKKDSTKRVTARPYQVHFHTSSEHMIEGRGYPGEIHFVSKVRQSDYPSCPKDGCYIVVGVFVELADESNTVENKYLQQILDFAPEEDETTNYFGANMKLDLNELLPVNRSYAVYEGSLTSPPCFEGILWHVMLNPLQISRTQLIKLMTIMGDTNCQSTSNSTEDVNGQYNCTKTPDGQNRRMLQPLNGRLVKFFIDQTTKKHAGYQDYIPKDNQAALTDGAIAGIVIGTIAGSLLTSGIGFLAYKQYKKRRVQKMFWGLSEENMRMMEKEYESNFRRAGEF